MNERIIGPQGAFRQNELRNLAGELLARPNGDIARSLCSSRHMAAKKKTSKSAFILDLALDMPANAVVAKASDAGVSITPAYVYAIRSSHRRAAKRTERKRLPTRGRTSKNETVESQFVALVLDVGLSRAEDLLAKVRAQVPTFRI